jgi:hypothetical protein
MYEYSTTSPETTVHVIDPLAVKFPALNDGLVHAPPR